MTRAPGLRLHFVGDVSLGSPFWSKAVDRLGPAHPSHAVQELIGNSDIAVANLECCFVDGHELDGQTLAGLAAPTNLVECIRSAGFSACNLANNHILDAGIPGLRSTQRCLDEAGIVHFGAGLDLRQACRPVFINRKGRNIAFLGAGDTSRYFAGKNVPGIAPLTRLAAGIRKAASSADLVVVSLHSDLEFSSVPGRWRQKLSRRLIDEGAHLVIQHHPHVLQGVEEYNGGLIAYSLGNFIFRIYGNRYQESRADVTDSVMLGVSVHWDDAKRPVISWDATPVTIGADNIVRQAGGDKERSVLEKLERRSRQLADPRLSRHAWWNRCREEAIDQSMAGYYALAKQGPRESSGHFRNLLSKSESWRWIRGLLTGGIL